LKKQIDKLCDTYNIEDVEKHIFNYYLVNNEIKYDSSDILKKYFSGFKLNQKLLDDVNELEINSFIDLEKSQELLIPKEDRKVNGTFFTPRNIVDKIIEEVKPKYDDICSDISCGCGSFLIGLIKYFKNIHGKTISQSLSKNIYGYDILDYNIKRTKILITIFGLENGEIIKEENFNLEVCDSLKKKWEVRFDIVVGNPPYVKFQDMNEDLRNYLLNNFVSIKKGTYNLYFSFFELGYNILNENGKLGYITPNNYFTSLSGEPLREFFEINKSIEKIIDFNSKKVFDVLTYTCLTFLNKTHQTKILFNKFFDGDFNDFINDYNINLSTILYENLKTRKWRLLLNKDQKNIHKIENKGRQIGDLFTINVGIATLRDDLYFIDGINKNGFFKLLDGEEYKIEDELVKSVYKISDFNNQDECFNNQRKIIFPYKVINNKSQIIEESVLEKEYPFTFKYFTKLKDQLLKRSKKEILEPFYQYGRSQGLNKFGIRLLTPTFSKKPNFLTVIEKDSLYCNGYGVHYNIDQNRISLFDNLPIQNPENIDVLSKILNSDVMDYYVKTTSVTIDGGYPCYQKNFIELFTIPNLDISDIEKLRSLDDRNFENEIQRIYDLNLE
jgi:adenine-specific DNA-methyltransferase